MDSGEGVNVCACFISSVLAINTCDNPLVGSMNVRDLLGQSPSSPILATYLSSLSSHLSSSHVAIPEIKAYPDVVYFNYYSLGLSLLFIPINGYKPSAVSRQDLQDTLLVLDGPPPDPPHIRLIPSHPFSSPSCRKPKSERPAPLNSLLHGT